MANLIIDIGNTRTKVAVFNDKVLEKIEYYEAFTPKHLKAYLSEKQITHSVISSVKSNSIVGLEKILESKTHYIRFSTTSQTSIINQYKSPQTLGLDRLAAVIGARALYPQSSCLVIDAGTCITYDAIDCKGLYQGGNISPGLHMRLKALHSFTGNLPLVSLDNNLSTIEGNDTPTAILSGVINGTVLEIKGFIHLYSQHYSNLQVILCGGDAFFFDTRLKNTIFAHPLNIEPNLVLIGLNEVIPLQNA